MTSSITIQTTTQTIETSETTTTLTMSKTTRILETMIGRRTNQDIKRLAYLYLNTKISEEEYQYLIDKMDEDGVDSFEDSAFNHEDPNCTGTFNFFAKPRERYRKNKQKNAKGKPKHKRK